MRQVHLGNCWVELNPRSYSDIDCSSYTWNEFCSHVSIYGLTCSDQPCRQSHASQTIVNWPHVCFHYAQSKENPAHRVQRDLRGKLPLGDMEGAQKAPGKHHLWFVVLSSLRLALCRISFFLSGSATSKEPYLPRVSGERQGHRDLAGSGMELGRAGIG